jgi:hypothetical protein
MTQSKADPLGWRLNILNWGITALIVGGLGGLVGLFDTYFPPLTVEQQNYCQLKAACGDYQTARQACAVAGDFSNCLSVKLGPQVYHLQNSCDINGSLLLTTASAPSALHCSLGLLRRGNPK